MSDVPSERVQCKEGDGKECQSITYIKSVTITPHNEPNDVAYPGTNENPDQNSIPRGVCTPSSTHDTATSNCHPFLNWYHIDAKVKPPPGIMKRMV